jgi:predicted alpha/beta hydrolase family esterase
VAVNAGKTSQMTIPDESNHGFYSSSGYDFFALRRSSTQFVVWHSEDDKWVPYRQGQENACGLGAKFYSFTDQGHFGRGVATVPFLLDEIL